jgi:ABC-type multidrug transport system fused ATPase/permease subunit
MIVRFLSAVLPLITIYQFSFVVKLIESKSPLEPIIWSVVWIFVVRLLDNFLRIKSTTRLDHVISNISFDVHNFFLSDLKTQDKEERHAIIQAVRNFADAVIISLRLIKQPGVDSLVSLIVIPSILFFLDFQIFILTISYILVYYFIDNYTTQRYSHLKDILNTKTETYYAKLQDSNDYDLEQVTYTRHHRRLTRWSNTEWFTLQNIAVFFYSLILLYLITLVNQGTKEISDLVLIIGYVSQTQTLLNSLSEIKDSFADMFVGLEHLAKNTQVSAINLDDLI